jgi:hypothetical protein
MKEGQLDRSHICLVKDVIIGKIGGKEAQEEDVSIYWMILLIRKYNGN